MTQLETSSLETTSPILLGLDLGTSGLRAALVQNDRLLAEYEVSLPFPQRDQHQSQQHSCIWQDGLTRLLHQLKQSGWTNQISAIIADATSSTVMLSDKLGQPITPALMYDDKRAQTEAQIIKSHAPATSGAQGASSTLAKVLWLAQHQQHADVDAELQIMHQIDWLNFQLCGELRITDENNALKLGYDSINQTWPDWVKNLCPLNLPQVVPAGTRLSYVSPTLAERWGFKADCTVYSGTTDSLAAFLASGADQIGDAVTALGSTLAIKLLSEQPIFAAEYGIYSHRLLNKWLVGGASNAGGAVLLHYFSLAELIERIPKLDLSQATGLACYPLIQPGERFPISDPHYSPIIPQTHSKQQLLQVLIEGLVAIEKQAFDKLHQLGAPVVKRIFSVGGGTRNQAWLQLRAQQLPAKLSPAFSQSAAYGVTRLIRDVTRDT